MADARDKYLEPEERLALRTEDVYQTDKDVDTLNYSERLLEIVATFSNSGQPEGWSVQSMVGRSKRGEVALRLFAVVEPVEDATVECASQFGERLGKSESRRESAAVDEADIYVGQEDGHGAHKLRKSSWVNLADPELLSQWRFGPVGFKSRGCLAMTACASVMCSMIEGLTFAEALRITPEDVKEAVGGVPWDKLHTPVFAVEAVHGLVGDWLIRQGVTFDELEALLPCDSMDPHCLVCEHCSLRACRTDLRMDAVLAQARVRGEVQAQDEAGVGEGVDMISDGGVDEGPAGSALHATPGNLDSDNTTAINAGTDEDVACMEGMSPDAGVDARPEATFDISADVDAGVDLTLDVRELLENNALADVFDLARDYSADSQLLTPALWADLDLVPDFTTADDFEMFVYEYLEAYRREHPLTQEKAPHQPDETRALSPDERTSAHGFRSATRAVGIAPSIRDIMAAKSDEASSSTGATSNPKVEPSPRTAAGSGTESEAEITFSTGTGLKNALPHNDPDPESDQPTESASNLDGGSAAKATSDMGFASSPGSTDVAFDPTFAPSPEPKTPSGPATPDDNPYAGLRLPKGYEMVQLENGEWAMAPIPADRVPERREIHCEDVVVLTGQYTYYLYDRSQMTDSYAHWAFLAAENDPLVTFADLVREDSRTYPRPMAQKNLHNEPFVMSAKEVEQAFELALRTKGYEDIQRCEASNGDVYYFSTTYLSPRQAEALAEWASVERVANP